MPNKIKIVKNDINIESKKIVDSIIKKIYEDYKNIPHNELSYEDAYDNIEDLVAIKELINRIIIRRNNSYKN